MISGKLYAKQKNTGNIERRAGLFRFVLLAGMLMFGVQAVAQVAYTLLSPQSLTVCENAAATSISSLLQATESGIQPTFTWSVNLAPGKGVLTGFNAIEPSGTNVQPAGTFYTPNSGATGFDVFVITVSDGFNSNTMTINVTINSNPGAVFLPGPVCVGSNILTTDGTTGGTFTSSNAAIASVGPTSAGTATVTGVAAGNANISYTLGATGCYTIAQATVNPQPAAITGSAFVCTANTTSLTETVGGGSWTSSNNAVATVSSSGVVSGVAAGTFNITYTLPAGCFTVFSMTCNQTPPNMTGPTSVCTGTNITLADGTGGGLFSSSNPGQASVVGATGVVTGNAAGSPTITYTVPNGCYVSTGITVLQSPATVAGPNSVCVGAQITLTDLTPGGAWTTSNTLLATVGAGSGIVTGVAAGSPNITYTAANGCIALQPLSVNNNPVAIAGTTFQVCTGNTITVTDATGGGTWSSSNAGLASISAGGVITGNSTGVPVISYTLGTGCYAVQNVNVNQTPVATTGTNQVCVGSTVTLTNTTGGGTWSSSDNTIATVVSGTGVVSGIAAGSCTISYVMPTGCYALFTMNVNNNPAAIGGPNVLCVGSNITVSDATGGGTFSSSNTSLATVSGTTVTGIAAGNPILTYMIAATGCYATESITVNGNPTPVSGTLAVCAGSTTALASSPAGGTWSSSNAGVATVVASGAGAGTVSGVAFGTSNITYSLATGCYAFATVTVNPLPTAIGGTASVCVGATTTLTDGGGGIWTSSNTGLATVGAGTGIVSGVAAGSPTITYTLPTGCYVTQVVVVNSNPAAIGGTTNVCAGSSVTLNDATGGGTWSSSNSSLASVGAGTGVVTGVAAGSPTISYVITATGCYATTSFVVNPLPAAISGTMAVCTGATTALTDATGGGTWSSSDITKATVNAGTGVVTGVAAGSPTISYVLGTGCLSTATVVVNQTPVAITGTSNVCVGLTTTLSDATPGGTWSSSNTTLATVVSGTGVVSGLAAGSPVISYIVTATGCYATQTVVVNPLPAAIGGTTSVCVGATTLLTDATSGGTWSSSNPGLATIGAGTGIVTGVAAGSPTMTYTLPTGCISTVSVVVNPLPAAITGITNVCTGFTTTLNDATGTTTWSSSNTTLATVGAATGVVSGLVAGVPTITFTIPATGCYTTTPVTVNPTPSAITGAGSVCVGSTATLADATGGGLWTSSNVAFATVGAGTGTVTGVGAGTPTITYTMATGCYVTASEIVNPLPAGITGVTNVCIGLTTVLADATPGGTWTSSNTAEATVTASGAGAGTVTGVTTGVPVITYTLPTSCYVTTPVTVNPNPTAIGGLSAVCTGSTITLSSTPSGGTWSSSNAAQATVGGATGVVTGVAVGSPTITYTLATGCLATKGIVVNQTPASIAGTLNVCVGLTSALTDATVGGNWTSSNTSQATVVGGTGVVTGVAAGIPVISYTMGTGCYATTPFTVNPNPASITGATSVCTGYTVGLADVTAGGTWSSSDATRASINAASGVVTGVAAGSPTMTYTLSTGCLVTYPMVVNTTPLAITGPTNVCTGANITLADATTGGSWTSSNTSEATVVSGTGVVTGVAAGTPTISYSMATGCYVTYPVVVNQTPVATTGTASVCVGLTTVLSDATAGGTWSSTNPAQATVGATTGIVTGVAAGNPGISYTMATGCYYITPITVNPTPASVTGPGVVCVGSNITMADATSGGLWSSGNTSTATVNAATGVVTGVAAGVVGMTYTLGGGCTASANITVNPVPNISNFTSTIATSECVGLGGTVTVSSTSLGVGSFVVTYNLSGANAVTGATATLTMGATNGTFSIPAASLTGTGFTTVTITGISNGFGCTSIPLSNNASTFSVNPLPTVYNVTGGGGYCVGGTGVHVYLSNSVGGVNYQLWLGATAVGAPMAGTFSGLDFGAITTVGTYSVTATNATTGCASNMFGTATIFTNPLPTQYVVTGGGSYCSGGTGVTVGLASSQASVNYQLYIGTTATGSPVSGTGSPISFGLQTTAGTYTVIATNTTTSCTNTMTGSAAVVINPLPSAISGSLFACPGTTTTLTDATTGGTWSSTTATIATVGAATGVVTGVAAGTTTIVYTLPTTCSTSSVVTINALPASISGLTTVCAGSAITLADATGGGTWSSSNPLIATVGVTTGIVTGVAAGSPTITYTLPSGCYSTFNIVVNPMPTAILGTPNVCAGLTTSLTDLTTGGVWTSATPAIASIGVGTWIVTGASTGTTTITYTLPAGCYVTQPFTVNPVPAGITGASTVCVGLTTTMADATSGGTWSSSNTSIATINVASGVVTGIASGVVTLTYALPAGCTSTTSFTVNPTPAAITGTNNVCAGLTTPLLDASAGGTWSSSNGAVATVNAATGVVTGVAAGSATITYTLPAGCTATYGFVVNPLPLAITGTGSVCIGLTTTLNDGSAGGSWSSSNIAIASVGAGTGIVTGVTAGTATITYTLPTGCINTTLVTVNPLPVAITGITTVCAGSTTNLFDASAGGSWTSSNAALATINAATGVVTGVSAGSPVMTYTLPTGCITTTAITVYPSPVAIAGPSTVCVGLTSTLSDGTSGGTWSSSNASLASIVSGTGVVTGMATGTPIMTYTLPAPGSCYTTMVVTVNPQPVAISGTFTVCAGSTTTLADLTTGGSWTSSNTAIATVGAATGLVTGVSAGTVNITYTLPAGCFVVASVLVYPTPLPITGTANVCVGLTTSLTELTTGGTWTSSSASATVNSITGVVTGVSAGYPIMTYTLPPGGCIATYPVTVNPLPVAISGTASVCVGGSATVTDGSTGGSWTSGNPAIATIGGTTGIIRGISAGTAALTYTLPTGCITTGTATVNALPNIYSVTGGGTYCASGTGVTVGLSGSDAGLSYQLYLAGVATGSPVTGTGSAISFGTVLTAGNYTVVATNTTTSCTSNMSGSATVTITVLPTAYSMTGGGAFCLGGAGVAVGLSGSAAGNTYQLYLGTVPIGAALTGTGASLSFGSMTGGGTYTVVATNTFSGCTATMAGTSAVTVNPLPAIYTVTGGGAYCTGGTGVHIGLNNSTVGVNYTLSGLGTVVPGSGAAIDFGAVLTAGTYTISALNATTGCSSTMAGSAIVTISALPTVYSVTSTGTNPYCAGGAGVTINLSSSQAGTTYQLFLGTSATGAPLTGGTGALTFGAQLAPGAYTVVATNSTTGCTANMTGTINVLVNPAPHAFHILPGSGGAYCAGGTGVSIMMDSTVTGVNYRLFNGATGGTTIAGTGSGITFTGVTAAGTYTIVGTAATTCTVSMSGSATVSISPLPNAYPVTGGGNYCTGTPSTIHVTVGSSDAGISYQLYNGTTAIGAPVVSGTAGSVVDFGTETASATPYTVVATNPVTMCVNNMTGSATVSLNPSPVSTYSVTGGGSYCAGGTGINIQLTGSQTGVYYKLYAGGTSVDSLAGTTTPINFGNYLAPAVYTVVATNMTTGCTATMPGAPVVSITAAPTAFTVSGGGSYCGGGAGLPVNISGSATGVNYQLLNGTAMVGMPVAGTGAAMSFGSQVLPGTYTVMATNAATGCTATMPGSAVIVVNPAPNATYFVTGGGSYCVGGSGVLIGLSSSDTGVSYQLYHTGIASGLAVSGTGSAISFGAHFGSGVHTVTATRVSTGCMATMTGGVTVSVNPLPAVHNVTGGGAYCPGGVGEVVGVDTTNTGIRYQLYFGTDPIGATVAGTGAAVSFGLQTGIGSYSVVAVNPATGCTRNMTGTANISYSSLPTAYAVAGGGGYCVGGTGVSVTLAGSQTGVNYQLYLGTSTVGVPLAGTGVGLTFPAQTALGTYMVIATSGTTGCSNNMTGSTTISLNPLPTQFNVTGGGSYCAGGSGEALGLSGSATGISYQLLKNSLPVGAAISGSSSALSFGTRTDSGSYTVIATNVVTGCSNNMTGSANISINSLPISYTVTGGGVYCAGGTGRNVGLSASDAGIDYQLMNGMSAVGVAVAGSGSAVDFGAQTATGSYTIVATNPVTMCSSVMTGTATVSTNPLPVSSYAVTGGGAYCAGGTGLVVGLSGTSSGVSYQLYNGTTATGAAVAGTGSSLSFGAQTAAGSYSVTGVIIATGCTSTMTGSVTVVVNPLPVIDTVTGGGNYCPGGAGNHIGLTNSTIGVGYQLYRGITAIGTPIAGTNAALDFGLQTIAGTYFVTAVNSTTGCTSNMVGSPAIGFYPLPVVYNLNASATGYCLGGSGVDLTLSGSDVGMNYQLFLGTTPVGAPVAGTGFLLDFGYQTSAGTYSVMATNAMTSCTNNMAGMPTVVINTPPAAYTVSGGGGFCAGGTGVPVLQSGSDLGVTYQLYNGATTVGSSVTGTGYSLNFGLMSTPGIYTVVATATGSGCTSNMLSSASVTANPLPTAYYVVGGGSYCAGGTGRSIGVNNTDIGISYQLYRGATAVGLPVGGTTGTIDFGAQTVAGVYKVVATNTTTSCMSNMYDSAIITINALPVAYTVTGGGNYCTGGTGVHIGLSGSATGVMYSLMDTTASIGTAVTGTSATVDFGLVATPGTYTVMANDPSTGCAAAMTGSAVVIVSALPATHNVTGGGSYCASAPGVGVGVATSDLGINYQLYNGTGVVGAPIIGSGGAINFGLHGAGTYTVMGINATTGCMNAMTGSAVVTEAATVVPSVTIATGVGDTVCTGTSVTFMPLSVNGGTAPGYQWYVNGLLTDTGSSFNFVPANGNVISVVMSSNAACAIPPTATSAVTMTVRPNLTPSVSIAAASGTTVCQGSTVNFSASVINGGSAPSLTWMVGGSPMGSGNTFSYMPADGDIVFCSLTSSYQCLAVASAISNNITMGVQTNVPPTVSIILKSGANVGPALYNDTLVAEVSNPGTSPMYQWSVNGVVVAGANTATLYRTSLNNLDQVFCAVIDSNACGKLSGFNQITVMSANVSVPTIANNNADVKLIPNPNNGSFTVKGSFGAAGDQELVIEVTDVLGKVIYSGKATTHNGSVDEHIVLENTPANGMYLVTLRSGSESQVFHMMVEQ